MKQIIPNLVVEPCTEALDFYKKVFDGEIRNIQFVDGKEMFAGQEGKVVHAELAINAQCVLYLCDALRPKTSGDNISLMLQLESIEEIDRLFLRLCENGTVIFPLQKTFWGADHAVVRDKYGIVWHLDYTA